MLQIEAGFFLVWAALLLILPLDWCFAAFLAAAIHELCHMGMLILLGGRVRSIQIGISGAVIEGSADGAGENIAATLAGPAGSLLLLLFLREFPKLALCGLVQGAYNLLPIFPLDGGRALQYVLMRRDGKSADKILYWAECASYVLLAAAAILLSCRFPVGVWPVFLVSTLILKSFLRKIPCKRKKIRVQ